MNCFRHAHDRQAVRRRRFVAASVIAVVATTAAVIVVRSLAASSDAPSVLVPRNNAAVLDPLAYDGARADDLERAAAFGLSHPLFARSPGGVLAAAGRTASFRELVERAVAGTDLDADIVEAIVFLESAGRREVIAGDDPARASGLTQILAETAQNFLGMKVDLALSRELTTRIAAAVDRGDSAEADRLRAARRKVDERFDPEQALAATVRYLTEARRRLGRDDLAVVSYHMGIGNLTNVLRAYAGAGTEMAVPDLVDEQDLTWARIFFDSTPVRNLDSYRLLERLGDDSPTYYWRVLAAEEIMRLYRDDRARLRELAVLHAAKRSAEEVLHPPIETERFADESEIDRAWESHLLQPVPNDPGGSGSRSIPRWERSPRGSGDRSSSIAVCAPRPLRLLVYLSNRVHTLSGATQPLMVTSAVRDEKYQRLLRTRNTEATARYSLHTTGFAFDVRRRYESDAQAQAFQFELEDLTARGLIAWVREPAAIHVTVSSDAEALVAAMLEPAPEAG